MSFVFGEVIITPCMSGAVRRLSGSFDMIDFHVDVRSTCERFWLAPAVSLAERELYLGLCS